MRTGVLWDPALVEYQAGREPGDVVDVPDAGRGNGFFVEHGDAQRDVLYRFGPFSGRDDDFFDFLCRQRGGKQGKGGERDRRARETR